MSSISSTTRIDLGQRQWVRPIQGIGVVGTGILIAGLVIQPEFSLRILWDVLIPILPVSFMVTPALWRSICPLATLNMLSNGLVRRRAVGATLVSVSSWVGILLLAALVPARRFWFNDNGPALAAVISLIGAAALGLGAFFDAKAGFCNSICPVLPVERLYGQSPILAIGNPRCSRCSVCIPKGCIDLAPARSIAESWADGRRARHWLTTAHGVFAAAFPGFVIGYFTTTNTEPASAATVYLHVAAWAGGSFFTCSLFVRMLNVRAALALPILAASAVGLYYWFVAPRIASMLYMADSGSAIPRTFAVMFVSLWLLHALTRNRRAALRR